MLDTMYPTSDQLAAHKRGRSKLIFILFSLTILLVFGLIVILEITNPSMSIYAKLGISIAVFIVFAVPVTIWMEPVRGLQFIFFMCMLIENDGRTPPIMLPTNYLPFFLNFNLIGTDYGTSALEFIKFSPAEAIMVLAFGSWLIRSIAKRDLQWQSGKFFPIIMLMIVWVTFGFIHGMVTGGDFLLALWEVRAIYLFAATYLITTNLITNREQLKSLAWIIVVGLGLRSLLGVYAYSQLVGNITDQGILQHEDSLLFNLLFFLPIILIFNKGPRALIWGALAFVPSALFADLENNRRAGIAAFIIAFAALLLLAWFLMSERKKQLGAFIIVIVAVAAIYLPVAWNAQGQWAFPARAIRSQFSPNDRDAGSDAYRMMEDADLKFTRDMSPWIGVGYGKPWIEFIPLPRVSTGFLQYVAHDSVLWIWMRLGHVGFFIFLMLIAQVLIYGPQYCRGVRDPLVQTFGIIAILYMLMAFIYGKYDLQFANYRSMIVLGVFLGLLGNLPKFAAEPERTDPSEVIGMHSLTVDPDMTPTSLDQVPAQLNSFP
jgi:hypothetical protein